MLPLLMRILSMLAVALVAMAAAALFLFLFFGVPFATGFTAGAVVGIAASGLCGWLLWWLDEEQGAAAPRRRGS